ncbi:hypothetical protein ASG06_03545 [Rathayibacter sp. Leaf185]|nr:hypothetical protein ASF42_03535 [Rathayibacter sp. Leaf294]KQS13507.1 hypothetical protein ASG06_03545 [Rathayibacter sp. Leaf185]
MDGGARGVDVVDVRTSRLSRLGVAFPIAHSARIIDAVLMGLIVYRLPAPFLPVVVPVAQSALIVLLAISLFRKPTRSLLPAAWYPFLCLGLLVFVVAISVTNDLEVERRAGNIALVMLMAGFLASGRIDVASALKGIGVALALNAALFAAGVTPDAYQGALTGVLQDKNVAGLFYGVAALLVMAATSRRWLRIAVLVAGGVAVVATDSRTSMAAFACGVLWLVVTPRLGLFFRALTGLGIYLLFVWAEANLSTAGVYGVERAGSDLLRERILQSSLDRVALAPWTGSGLGQATADVDGTLWFFHNSYLALLAEGGVVLLVGVLLVYVVAGFGLLPRRPDSFARHAVGAATITVLLSATQLGEVFFAPISFVVVGAGLALLAERREDPLVPPLF